MKTTAALILLILLTGCSYYNFHYNPNRSISSVSTSKSSNLEDMNWHFVSTTFSGLNYVYTPFFVDGLNVTMYTGGAGVNPGNGVLKLTSTMTEKNIMSESVVVKTGPDSKNYNYFRAPRVAKNGNELWMLVEVSGCYTGCDTNELPKSMAVYKSTDDGKTWTFLDYQQVDGKRYVAQWFAETGLIYNPKGSNEINLKDLTKNKFITIGESTEIHVSADGIHYRSVKMNHPFPKDRLIFASFTKTPFGYHMMTNANWSDKYYTLTVRHLFSKDLVNWIPLESNSSLKNPLFYKGVHLSYDEKANKLWAVSPCGTSNPCSFVAWMTPKDFSKELGKTKSNGLIPVGEFVHFHGDTAMILDQMKKGNATTYKIRYANGKIDSGFTKDMFQFPLEGYNRQGCEEGIVCVGDAVNVNGQWASVMGILFGDPAGTKYAIKFTTGVVDTGYLKSMFTIP
jgi:hypothetical protein